MRELERVAFITHWGWRRPHIHRPGVDVVVPPMLKVAQLIDESPYLHPERNARPGTEYRYLLSFVGSVRPHTPGYSFGVRQAVFARYANDTRFFLRDARGESKVPRSRRDRVKIAPRQLASAARASAGRRTKGALSARVPLGDARLEVLPRTRRDGLRHARSRGCLAGASCHRRRRCTAHARASVAPSVCPRGRAACRL